MIRWLLLAVLVACEAPPERLEPAQDHPNALPVSWPSGPSAGVIGRELAPQWGTALAIEGELVHADAIAQVPGDGSARGVVSGEAGVEMIDIDAHRVAWRGTCGGPVAGVTARAIVCAAKDRTRVLALDGKPAWDAAAPVVAVGGDRVVTAAGSNAVAVRDDATGDELATVALGSGVAPSSVLAACDRDVYAVTADGKLARIGGKLVWAAPLAPAPLAPAPPAVRGKHPPAPSSPPPPIALPAGIDPCEGPIVLALAGEPSARSLVALARDSGKLLARIDGVRGVWPARGKDRIAVATASGVTRMSRALSDPEVLPLPPLGELLARRGELRLVRATPSTAVLLDARGVRAFVALPDAGAALGDTAILAAGDRDALADGRGDVDIHLRAIPPRWERPLRLPQPAPGVALPAELRDLPAVAAAGEGIPLAGGEALDVDAAALDPVDAAVYVAAEGRVARFDLAARTWTWTRPDACPAGDAVALAASRAVIACGTREGIRALSHDGAILWRSELRGDAIEAAADIVLAHAGDRVRVLDAHDGHLLGTIATAHAAALDIGDMPLVVAAEAGRIVARLPRVDMLPAWSLDVRGVVTAIAAAGDGVLVTLEDGDAYRIDARTAHRAALPNVGLDWHAAGDLVIGDTAGGPVPPEPPPVPPAVPEVYKPADLEAAPAIATPWPPPPPMPASRQLALFELGGGARARDDYAITEPIAFGARRGASPIVVVYGARPRHVLVLDPVHGDPLQRIELPLDAPSLAFSTVVDGRPVAGTILAAPLRVVLF